MASSIEHMRLNLKLAMAYNIFPSKLWVVAKPGNP